MPGNHGGNSDVNHDYVASTDDDDGYNDVFSNLQDRPKLHPLPSLPQN